MSQLIGNLPKFRPNNLNFSILTEKGHTWCLDGSYSDSGLRFLKLLSQNQFWANLCQKSQSCLFCLKIITHGISRMLVLIPPSVF